MGTLVVLALAPHSLSLVSLVVLELAPHADAKRACRAKAGRSAAKARVQRPAPMRAFKARKNSGQNPFTTRVPKRAARRVAHKCSRLLRSSQALSSPPSLDSYTGDAVRCDWRVALLASAMCLLARTPFRTLQRTRAPAAARIHARNCRCLHPQRRIRTQHLSHTLSVWHTCGVPLLRLQSYHHHMCHSIFVLVCPY